MEPNFLIKPRWRGFRSALFFETDSLNALMEAEYNDKFGFYQSQFGVYSYMTLNSELDFVIHYPEGTPLMWQVHNNCAWTPTGTLIMRTDTMTPTKVKLNEQRCYDEFFNSTYKAFNEWDSNPTIGFSQAGVAATDALTRTLVKNATMGARTTMVAGKLFDTSNTTFEDGVSVRIEDAWKKTSTSAKGWLQLVQEVALTPGNEHLDGDYIQAADISSDGKTFEGDNRDIVDLYDQVLEASPTALQDAIIEGGVGALGNTFFPLFLCALPEYRAVDKAWKAQKESALQNEPRIRRESFTYEGRTIRVFYIDDTVVIPIAEPAHFTKYVTGTAHFVYLTISGVINLGGSFGNLPAVSESEVAVMMQMSENAEDYGTMKFLAHALMGCAINDTQYICGDYLYATPA